MKPGIPKKKGPLPLVADKKNRKKRLNLRLCRKKSYGLPFGKYDAHGPKEQKKKSHSKKKRSRGRQPGQAPGRELTHTKPQKIDPGKCKERRPTLPSHNGRSKQTKDINRGHGELIIRKKGTKKGDKTAPALWPILREERPFRGVAAAAK